MSYIRYDYTFSDTGALHGLVYENSAIVRPINEWRWETTRTLIYAEAEVYSPYNPVWNEVYAHIGGYFEYDEYGSLQLGSATVSLFIGYSSGGYASVIRQAFEL